VAVPLVIDHWLLVISSQHSAKLILVNYFKVGQIKRDQKELPSFWSCFAVVSCYASKLHNPGSEALAARELAWKFR
jgi:hypothetical protein